MMTPEECKAQNEMIREHWQQVFTGVETLHEMPWQHRRYPIDQMFDGVDEHGRPFGVYVRNVKAKVFEYEIYGRFTEAVRFLKAADDDYPGPETKSIEAEWDRSFQAEKAAYRANRKKSSDLEMGGTGLEHTAFLPPKTPISVSGCCAKRRTKRRKGPCRPRLGSHSEPLAGTARAYPTSRLVRSGARVRGTAGVRCRKTERGPTTGPIHGGSRGLAER